MGPRHGPGSAPRLAGQRAEPGVPSLGPGSAAAEPSRISPVRPCRGGHDATIDWTGRLQEYRWRGPGIWRNSGRRVGRRILSGWPDSQDLRPTRPRRRFSRLPRPGCADGRSCEGSQTARSPDLADSPPANHDPCAAGWVGFAVQSGTGAMSGAEPWLRDRCGSVILCVDPRIAMCAAHEAAAGRWMVNTLPRPSSVSSVTRPPIPFTISTTIFNPSPAPGRDLLIRLSIR